MYVLLPTLAQSFGLSPVQIGLIRSAHRSAMALFQIPVGFAADRLGPRNLLVGGTALAGLAYIALSNTTSFAATLAAFFAAGMGSAVQHPICSTIVSRAYTADAARRFALGMYNSFGDLGKCAIGALLGLLLMVHVPWRASSMGLGLVGIATAVVLFALVRRIDPTTPTSGTPAVERRDAVGTSNRAFVLLCVIAALDSSTSSALLTFVAFLLISKGVTQELAQLAVPLVLIGGIAGKFGCGVLAARIGVVRTIITTETLTGALIFTTLALPGTATLVLLPFVGVVLQGTSSALYASVGDLVDRRSLARAFGVLYSVGAVCGVVAPLAFGLAGTAFGVEYAIGLMGIMVLLNVPLTYVLRVRLESGAGSRS